MNAQDVNRYPQLTLLKVKGWQDYELLDSGNGKKLERFGAYCLVRPEAEAIWQPSLPEREWKLAHAVFHPSQEEMGGHWEVMRNLPSRWMMEYKGLRFYVQTTASRHVGVFPEQAGQWDWLTERIQSCGRPLRVLNLFGYTGLATLAAARAGAQVTHVDASPKVVGWARDNQGLSGLGEAKIRWIVDDALKFVRREHRRGVFYDGLILDPPKFGRGPKGEVWEFYKLIPELLEACAQVLSPEPQFVWMTAYSVKASSLTLYNAVFEKMKRWRGTITAGEVVLAEKSAGRLLAMSIFVSWSAVR